MNALLRKAGQAAGLLGMLLMAVSAAGRFAGRFTVADFQVGSFMLAGIAAVSVGCFFLLWSMADRSTD